MDLEEIPFKIGMQYENWEFDLEPVKFDGNNVTYKYIKGDIKTILGKPIKCIYLYFNFDILYRVEIVVNASNPLQIFTVLYGMLEATYGEQHIATEESLANIYVIWELEQMKLKLIYNFDLNRVYLEVEV